MYIGKIERDVVFSVPLRFIEMRCLFAAVSLGIVLALVSGDALSDLKKKLIIIAEETQLLIKQDAVQNVISLGESIIEANVADKQQIEDWKRFISNLQAYEETGFNYNQNTIIFPKEQMESEVNKDSNGTLPIALATYSNNKEEQIKNFETQATEIIRMAKVAGFKDDAFDKSFDKFVERDDNVDLGPFERFLAYLKA